jgi:methylenetetrahydrofolate dehydrogenase (NADP+)/methenyltetrahydrofolate cyclohydrolase
VDGLLVQLPLPKHINADKVINAIDPAKDVDGFHPINVGKMLIGDPYFMPCTPHGAVELMVRSGNPPDGKHVVICGRSNIVGKPLMAILVQKKKRANATISVVHTGTKNMAEITRQADILVAAMGAPQVIKADMVREGAVVIDVGVNRIPDPSKKSGFRLVGDVDFDAAARKSTLTTNLTSCSSAAWSYLPKRATTSLAVSCSSTMPPCLCQRSSLIPNSWICGKSCTRQSFAISSVNNGQA